jgi:hypothetical protein
MLWAIAWAAALGLGRCMGAAAWLSCACTAPIPAHVAHTSCTPAMFGRYNILLSLCMLQAEADLPLEVDDSPIVEMRGNLKTHHLVHKHVVLAVVGFISLLVVSLVGLGVAYAVYVHTPAYETVTQVKEKMIPFWPAEPPEDIHAWNYDRTSAEGPLMWGEMRNETTQQLEFPACENTGTSTQSPIQLPSPNGTNAVVSPINATYATVKYRIIERPAVSRRFPPKRRAHYAHSHCLV